MLVQADLIVRDAVKAFFDSVRTDPSMIDLLVSDRPQAEREEMKTYFSTTAIPVQLGYPRNAGELPGVFVVLGSLQETERGQTIGGVQEEEETSSQFTEWQGSFMTGAIRLCCWSLNANLTVWLQLMVFTALLVGRGTLNDQGLAEQKLSAMDFEPLPQWFPDFAFRRDVLLSAFIPISAPEAFYKIADIQVTATSNPDTVTRTVVVKR